MLYATCFMQYDKQYDIGNVLNIMCYVQIRYAICVKTLYAHTLCYVQYAIYSMICYMIYVTCNKLYAVCYLPYEWMKCFLLNIAFVALTQYCNCFILHRRMLHHSHNQGEKYGGHPGLNSLK